MQRNLKNNSKNKQTNRLNEVYEQTRFKSLPGSSGESFLVIAKFGWFDMKLSEQLTY